MNRVLIGVKTKSLKKINKEKLVQEGIHQIFWETFQDHLDWNERNELEEYVKEKLERNLNLRKKL